MVCFVYIQQSETHQSAPRQRGFLIKTLFLGSANRGFSISEFPRCNVSSSSTRTIKLINSDGSTSSKQNNHEDLAGQFDAMVDLVGEHEFGLHVVPTELTSSSCTPCFWTITPSLPSSRRVAGPMLECRLPSRVLQGSGSVSDSSTMRIAPAHLGPPCWSKQRFR